MSDTIRVCIAVIIMAVNLPVAPHMLPHTVLAAAPVPASVAGQTPQPPYCQNFKIETGSPLVRDLDGSVIQQTLEGSQIILEGSIKTGCDVPDYPIIMILEVRNASTTLTYHVSWQNTTIDSGQNIMLGSSWLVGEAGFYELRFFAIPLDYLDVPQPISLVQESYFLVVDRKDSNSS